ncbi:hypothetical protein HX773_23225 [Pantoea sp. B9002]|uniref:hypothetical protein n=1 Tax=Pantoea sp. B9002 TaxID=2726979 RepID=UPI0015A3BB75|nr:hypothetical protein [Pantoea sp. B9002]NWA63821.1 hypothetical protein [Pantoea sp. B9002]
MKNKRYSLKKPPPISSRPKPIKFAHLLALLAILLVLSTVITRLLGQAIESHILWWLAIGGGVVLWLIIFGSYLLVWLAGNIIANGKDNQRERWLLHETQKSRRALQILAAEYLTCHSPDMYHPTPLEAIMANTGARRAQDDRKGTGGVNHSQIVSQAFDKPYEVMCHTINHLLSSIIPQLEKLDTNKTIKIALNISSSVSIREVKNEITHAFHEAELNHPVEFIAGEGVSVINQWLHERFTDDALLLGIALQIDPPMVKDSAEAGVALLLGNRMTQQTLHPAALLHRPDRDRENDLAACIKQAADNVPLEEGLVQHLWIAGVTEEQYLSTFSVLKAFPVEAVETENVITPDISIGHAGAAAPWLAIAAAFQAATLTHRPQMIITGDTSTDDMWSMAVSPVTPPHERDT